MRVETKFCYILLDVKGEIWMLLKEVRIEYRISFVSRAANKWWFVQGYCFKNYCKLQKQRVAVCPLENLVHFIIPTDMKEILHSLPFYENENDTNFATFPLGSGLQTVKGKQKNVFAAVTKCRSCSSIWLALVSIPSSPDCEGLPGLQDKNNIISCQLLQPFL